jgi:hypothetical protein
MGESSRATQPSRKADPAVERLSICSRVTLRAFFILASMTFGDLAGEFCAVAFQVQLEIETKAARVQLQSRS